MRGDAGPIGRIRYEVGDCYRDPGSGQHDAAWLGPADFFASVCALPDFVEVASGMIDIAQSAGWFSPQFDVCWISERPSVVDLEARPLGAAAGPIVMYPDGFAVHAVPDESGARADARDYRRWRFGS